MNILSAPIFESSFTLVKAAAEVVNSRDFEGRYHITENGGIVIINKQQEFNEFINIFKVKFNEEIEREIEESSFDEEPLSPDDFDYNELEKFFSFLEDVFHSDYPEFIIESI